MSGDHAGDRSRYNEFASFLRTGAVPARACATAARIPADPDDRVVVETTTGPANHRDMNVRKLNYRGRRIANFEAADGLRGWTEQDEARMRAFIADVEAG